LETREISQNIAKFPIQIIVTYIYFFPLDQRSFLILLINAHHLKVAGQINTGVDSMIRNSTIRTVERKVLIRMELQHSLSSLKP